MRAMKDSGIEWIGQIPQDWQIAKVKHVYSFQTGWTPSTSNAAYFDGDLPWANISDIGKTKIIYDTAKHITEEAVANSSMGISPKGSLMYSFKLSVGDVSFCGTDMYTNEAIATFLPSDKYDLRYLYYAAPLFIIKNANENIYGAKLLNQELIRNALILNPPYNEQVSVADYLDAKCAEIDALIAAKEKTNSLLKERRQSIIYEAVTKGLNPDAPMKDSGIEWIGEIPENWGIAALKRVATPSTGMTPSKANSQYWEGDIPWFSSKDIKADYLFDSEDHISQQAVDECGLTVHDENSVVFCARSGILRHTFPVSVLKCKGTINQDLRALAASETIDPGFLMYYLRGMNNTIVTLYQKVGATVESIEMEWLLYLPVALPPVEEQKQIADYIVARCNEIDGQIAANEASVTKLKEYRQSIIYEAVTGKIEV